MKQLFLAAACAALLAATPALAQSSAGDSDANASSSATTGASPSACSNLPDAAPDQRCPTGAPSALSLGAAEATGTITTIDVAAGTVTLDDGKTYTMQSNVALNTFMPGQKVTFSFMERDGKLIVADAKAPADEPSAAPGSGY
jgi:Cu/Ag efflux protein CusF